MEVLDTGIGLPTNFGVQLFDEYMEVDERVSRQYGGIGLGLSRQEEDADYCYYT
jgi:signal transduction histidine kinase